MADDAVRDDRAPSIPWNLLTGYAGYRGVRAGLPRLAGTQTLYHGTTADASKKILEQGLLAAAGGAGHGATAGLGGPGYDPSEILKSVRDKVHVTATKPIARFHTHFAARTPLAEKIHPIKAVGRVLEGGKPSGKKVLALLLDQIKSHTLSAKGGRILGIDLPYERFETGFAADPGFGGISKAIAAVSPHDIESRYIRGSGVKQRLSLLKELLRGLPRYVKRYPGRFSTGAGLAAGGGYLAYNAARNLGRRATAKKKRATTAVAKQASYVSSYAYQLGRVVRVVIGGVK